MSINDETKNNLKNTNAWLRLLFVIFFSFLLYVAGLVLFVMIFFQIVVNLFTGESNERIKNFSKSLNLYIYDLLQYMTYNTEERPFPFKDWPVDDKSTDVDPPVATE
jgi:hypothetical protein